MLHSVSIVSRVARMRPFSASTRPQLLPSLSHTLTSDRRSFSWIPPANENHHYLLPLYEDLPFASGMRNFLTTWGIKFVRGDFDTTEFEEGVAHATTKLFELTKGPVPDFAATHNLITEDVADHLRSKSQAYSRCGYGYNLEWGEVEGVEVIGSNLSLEPDNSGLRVPATDFKEVSRLFIGDRFTPHIDKNTVDLRPSHSAKFFLTVAAHIEVPTRFTLLDHDGKDCGGHDKLECRSYVFQFDSKVISLDTNAIPDSEAPYSAELTDYEWKISELGFTKVSEPHRVKW